MIVESSQIFLTKAQLQKELDFVEKPYLLPTWKKLESALSQKNFETLSDKGPEEMLHFLEETISMIEKLEELYL